MSFGQYSILWVGFFKKKKSTSNFVKQVITTQLLNEKSGSNTNPSASLNTKQPPNYVEFIIMEALLQFAMLVTSKNGKSAIFLKVYVKYFRQILLGENKTKLF